MIESMKIFNQRKHKSCQDDVATSNTTSISTWTKIDTNKINKSVEDKRNRIKKKTQGM